VTISVKDATIQPWRMSNQDKKGEIVIFRKNIQSFDTKKPLKRLEIETKLKLLLLLGIYHGQAALLRRA
jgi:hypothetical protein